MKKNKDTAPGKISSDWAAWQDKLATVLAGLEEDQYLVIITKHGNQFVQFSAQGAFGLRAETTSNNYRAKTEKLSAAQMRALLQAGWRAPSGDAAEATPENDPDGSPNYFIQFAAPVAFATVARLTVRTFSEILRVPHPGWLQYEAFDDDYGALELPGLGLKRNMAGDGHRLRNVPQKLLQAIGEEIGAADLEFDRDGDITVRYGRVPVFVRLVEGRSHVRFHSPLLGDVEESPGLYARLNDINAYSTLLRYVYRNETLWAIADVGADPFDKALVTGSLRYFCQLADGLSASLQDELGGSTFFAEPLHSTSKH